MSVGPSGMIGSFAGTPLAQSKGTDTERAQQDTADQTRQVQRDKQSENAAGIGQTEEDQQASERDADGRRLWELGSKDQQDQAGTDSSQQPARPPKSKDPTGQSGNQVDLSG